MTSESTAILQAEISAERAVLGALLHKDVGAAAIITDLRSEFFSIDTHRVVFETIHRLVSTGMAVDSITLVGALRDGGYDPLFGRPAHVVVADLLTDGAVGAYVPSYVTRIVEAWKKRRLEQIALGMAMQARNGSASAEILTASRSALEDVAAVGRSSAERWPLLDAADVWDDVADIDFLVDTLLPLRGVIWVGGLPKRFKSLLLLYLFLAIASRRAGVATHFAVNHTPRVLYVTREDGAPRLKQRREDILAAWDERPVKGALRFVVRPRMDLLDPGHVGWIRDTCQREERTVAVLDTWTALSPSADPMGTADQARLAAVVVQLAEDINGAVVVVDHSRKNRPEGQPLSSADIFGPLQKWAAAEHILMLDAVTPHRIEVFVEGKDGESGRFFLDVSPRGSGEEKFTYAGSVSEIASAQRAVGDRNREAVHAALLTSPGVPIAVEQIAAETKRQGVDIKPDTIRRHVQALVKAERARQIGQGKATRYVGVQNAPTMPSSENAEAT